MQATPHHAVDAGHAVDNAVAGGLFAFGSLWQLGQAIRDAAPPWSIVPPLITSIAGLLLAIANYRRAFRATDEKKP